MNVEEVVLWGWKGLRLVGERVALVVVPEPGGRIISLTLDGVEALFTEPSLHGSHLDLKPVADVQAEKRELGWRHYGGYKTWLAPQDRWSDSLPFLDLDSGTYDYETKEWPDGSLVHVESPVCRETGMQLARTISLSSEGVVSVEQSMTNCSSQEVSWGLWDVTQVQGPGRAVLPVTLDSKFPGGVKAYSNEGRSVEVMAEYVRLERDTATMTCRQVEQLKYGTDSTEGWVLGLLEHGRAGTLAFLKCFRYQPGPYPHQTTVEVYDSGSYPYFELEVHSPLIRLAPGDKFSYSESWLLDWLPGRITRPEDWARRMLEEVRPRD